jgi:hypothetical protein
MKNENKKTWKKPELKKLCGKKTEGGYAKNPSLEDFTYYATGS